MDPNATLQLIEEVAETDRTEFWQAVYNLKDWLDRGGFEPEWSRHPRASLFFLRWSRGEYE